MGVAHPLPLPNNAVIVQSQIPIYILYHVKTASTITPRMLVQSAADGDADDLLEVIYAADETTRGLGWVLFNIANKKTLGENNASVTKATTFAAGDGCWVGMRIPIVEALLTTGSGTLLPGQRMVGAGAGLLKPHPADLTFTAVTTAATTYYLSTSTPLSGYGIDPTVALLLSRATTADAVQSIMVMPLW